MDRGKVKSNEEIARHSASILGFQPTYIAIVDEIKEVLDFKDLHIDKLEEEVENYKEAHCIQKESAFKWSEKAINLEIEVNQLKKSVKQMEELVGGLDVENPNAVDTLIDALKIQKRNLNEKIASQTQDLEKLTKERDAEILRARNAEKLLDELNEAGVKLQKENGRLREALKPFAEWNYPDEVYFGHALIDLILDARKALEGEGRL